MKTLEQISGNIDQADREAREYWHGTGTGLTFEQLFNKFGISMVLFFAK